jgi:hypothetical protein
VKLGGCIADGGPRATPRLADDAAAAERRAAAGGRAVRVAMDIYKVILTLPCVFY